MQKQSRIITHSEVMLLFLIPAQCYLLSKISQYNQKFRVNQQAGTNELLRMESLMNDVKNLKMQLNYSFQSVSKKYNDTIHKIYQILKDESAIFADQLQKAEYCDQNYKIPTSPSSDSDMFNTLHALDYQSTDANDPIFMSDIKSSLNKIQEKLKNEINIKYKMVQFVPLTEGTIYELKPFDYSQVIEAFDDLQAQTYTYQMNNIKQFFGTPDDVVLLIIDCSDVYSNGTRNSIYEAAQTFLNQISPQVNIKIMLVAEDILETTQAYVNLQNNTKFMNKFIKRITAEKLGYHFSQELLLKIMEYEVDIHQMYMDLSQNKDLQPVHRQYAFIIAPTISASRSYQLENFTFKIPTTFIRFDQFYINSKNGVALNSSKAFLTNLIKTSGALQVIIRPSISNFLQNYYKNNYFTKIEIYCNSTINPEYFTLSDAISQENQINANMFVQHAIQQALFILYPPINKTMLSNFSNFTIVSVPVYANYTHFNNKLVGFYNLFLNFSEIFEEPRYFLQYQQIVATSNYKGDVIEENLINVDQNNLQIIEQDDFLHFVDQQPINNYQVIRTAHILDRALDFSDSPYFINDVNDNHTNIQTGDCDLHIQDGYLRCYLKSRLQLYLLSSKQNYFFYLTFDLKKLDPGNELAQNSTYKDELVKKLPSFLQIPRYNTSLKLIVNQIARNKQFIEDNNQKSSAASGQMFQVQPQLFCTMDKALCGFTDWLNDELSVQERWEMMLQLLSYHNDFRNDATFMNYTRIIYFSQRSQYFTLQRHYLSLNCETLYANTTFLINLVCIPLPLLGDSFITIDKGESGEINYCKDSDQYALFINYDGVVEYSVHCSGTQNKQFIYNAFVNQSIFNSTQLVEFFVIMSYNNLTDNKKKIIPFLTDDLKNSMIYNCTLVQQQRGQAAYEQFEGGLLLIVAYLNKDQKVNQDVLKEYVSQKTTFDQEIEEINITFNLEKPLNFRAFQKVSYQQQQFDKDAELFRQKNTQLFNDIYAGEVEFVPDYGQIVIAVVCLIVMIIIYCR